MKCESELIEYASLKAEVVNVKLVELRSAIDNLAIVLDIIENTSLKVANDPNEKELKFESLKREIEELRSRLIIFNTQEVISYGL